MNMKEMLATLTIEDFELSDCGEYAIELREDERSAPAKVELKIAPTIKLTKNIPSNVLELHSGTDFAIEFVYGGFPEVVIKITLNDKPLDRVRSHIHSYDGRLFLRLKNLVQEDSGQLRIVAENEIGSAKEEIQLDVISVPSKPRNLIAFNITNRSVMLRWMKAEDNRSPVLHYVIERRMGNIQHWRNVGKCESEQFEFLAENLYPDESYSFRVFALNEVGEGAPSNAVHLVTLNESFELEETTILSAPCCLNAKLVEDGQSALITWDTVKEAEHYIVERSTLENVWKQVGVTAGTKFNDSFDGSLSYKYRVIVKKGDQLSGPSEETETLIVAAHRQEKRKQKSEITEMFDGTPEMTETKLQEAVVQKAKEEHDMIHREKTSDKVVEEVDHQEEAGNEAIMVAKKSKDASPKQKIKTEEKAEKDDEKKVRLKKHTTKKGEKRKKETKKKEIPESEAETAKNFELDKVEVEKCNVELKSENENLKTKLQDEKIESVEKLEDEKARVKETFPEVKPVENTGALETIELENDSEKRTRKKGKTRAKEEDGKMTVEHDKLTKKKSTREVKRKETLITKKEETEETDGKAIREEKLEVKPASTSVMIGCGTKSAELVVNIVGKCDECFWTKDGQSVDKKLVKTVANTSVLQLENVNELTSGQYHFTATNKTAKATADIHVTVTGYPLVN